MRVSLVCFDKGVVKGGLLLNGQPVSEIYPDLTTASEAGSLDVTQAKPLLENGGISFKGSEKGGPFDVAGDIARKWTSL